MADKSKNSEKFIPHSQYFQGGATTDFKMGIANSFYSSQNLDFRTFPSQMSILPASRAINTTMPDLMLAMDQDLNGVRYGVGSLGNVYRIDTSNDVSRIAQMTENGSAGLLYSQITDQLYIPGQSEVSMYGPVTRVVAQSTSVGPNNPATAIDGGGANTAWSNPDNVFASDGIYATCTGQLSNNLKISNFGFSLPSTAIVDGIIVTAQRYNDGFPQVAVDTNVTLLKSGTATGTNMGLAGDAWPFGAGGYQSYGSSSNLWGATWLYSDINSSGFGVEIAFSGPGKGATSFVDNVQIQIYYTLGNSNPAPIFRYNQFGKSASIANGCTVLYNPLDGLFDSGVVRNDAQIVGLAQGITTPSQVTNSFTNVYTLPNIIIEDSTDFCFFAPDIEPFYSIAVYFAKLGTGDITLTLHDSLYNILANVKIANGSLALGWNEFVFSSPVRAFVNASNTGFSPTYHFHLTSSVANDTTQVNVFNPSDLSSVDFLLFAYRLVEPNNGWHPTCYFTGTGQPLLCLGNGEYLSTYNFGNDANPSNGQWQRHVLSFKPGYEVCGLSVNNQYLVIACERRSADASRNAQDGCLYFWDGSTNAPNFFIDVPMGSPYGLYTMNNVSYFSCAGSLFAWSGGQTVLKVRRLGYQNTDYMDAVDQTRLNPNGMTSRYNILMMGYPSFTTDPNLKYGIWSWGAVEISYPNSYGYSYSQSIAPTYETYTSGNNLNLGMCQNFVDSMYSSWQYTDSNDLTHYGLDVIDNFSDPALFANWLSLIYDGGVVYKEKMAVRYKIFFEALPSGITLTPIWYLDRGSQQQGPTAGEGATEVFVEWNNSRFHELQWGFTITNDGTATSPAVILGVCPEIDPLSDEVDLIPGES